MTLQRRLTLFFILIVILPLVAAGFVVQQVVVSEVTRRAELALGPSLNTAATKYNERSQAAEELTAARVQGSMRFARLLERDSRQAISGFLASRVNEVDPLDFLIALDRDGSIIGEALGESRFVTGFEPPGPEEIVAAKKWGPGFTRTPTVPVVSEDGRRVGSIVGGFWLDEELLDGTEQSGVGTMVVANGRVVASTIPLTSPVTIDLGTEDEPDLELAGDPGQAHFSRIPETDMAIVAWTADAPIAEVAADVLERMLGLLILALVATVVLAFLLARLITRPLEELGEGARAISEGRYDYR
ncbi:MAG: hypothetical protein ACRDJ2_13115, partial [Actinomycetota bacterium]